MVPAMIDANQETIPATPAWPIALVQHPMYMLIKEDSECAERTPPWGEPTIERYIERIRENLAFVRAHHDIKIGYEWSALELELLAEDAPEVFSELAQLAREGRVTFYNGTYAQPHLQTLSAEANILQLEYGIDVYRRLTLPSPLTYAHQEASVHDQTPQLLVAFGLRYAALPGFFSTLSWLDEGELVIMSSGGLGGLRFVHGHEFVSWQGLDGTSIALYLAQPSFGHDTRRLRREAVVGLLHAPPIVVEIPDMVGMSDEWLARHEGERFVLLDQALDERYQQAPPHARARFYTNWSYIEGIRAEELSRADRRAQTAALRAESLQAMAHALTGRATMPVDHLWKAILRAQHHDVYCFCAPQLRAQAIERLATVSEGAEQVARDAAGALTATIRTNAAEGSPVVVLNTVPHAMRTVVEVPRTNGSTIVTDAEGQPIPTAIDPTGAVLRFVADLDGWGYRTYYARAHGEGPADQSEVTTPIGFENAFYRVVLQPDGAIAALSLQGTGVEFIDRHAGGGNVLTATDTRGISPRREGPATLQREEWEMPRRGRPLVWEPAGPARARRSPLGLTLTAAGRMGEQVSADVLVECYDLLPRIDITWTFRFDDATIGTFFDDESKLVARWNYAFAGEITHDIPCGVICTPAERPFFPTTWVDYAGPDYGIAQFHLGTPKYWVQGQRLSNLFAWGEDTDAIGNRLDVKRWGKSFDQRLRGMHTIRYAVYPHYGNWQGGGVIAAARAFATPPVAYPDDCHDGPLPARLTLLNMTDPAIVTTAVRMQDNTVLCRIYETEGRGSAVPAEVHGLRRHTLSSLAGDAIDHLRPFGIGTLSLVQDSDG